MRSSQNWQGWASSRPRVFRLPFTLGSLLPFKTQALPPWVSLPPPLVLPCSESISGETYKPTNEVERGVQTASLLLNPERQSRLTKMTQPTGSRLASIPKPPDVPCGAVPSLRELLLGPGIS